MKKTLITLLMLATIFSGTAFAWDKHPVALAGSDIAIPGLVADVVIHNHSNDVHMDDHCAHGAAHLVGIFFDSALPIVASAPGQHAALFTPLASLYISPLLRPPIV